MPPGNKATNVRNLVLEVTGRCNHACTHCYNPWRAEAVRPAAAPLLSRDEWSSAILAACEDAPISQVAVSGGEPLLRPDTPDIAADLQQLGLNVVVITNGARLTEACLRRFPAGCTFETTLFSDQAALHDQLAGRPSFARVLWNLARLRRYGHHLVVVCVVTRQNAHVVGRVIRLGVALGAQAVMLNRVNVTRRLYREAADLVPTSAQLRACLHEANEAAALYGVTVPVSVPVPPCVVDPTPFRNLHFGWCPRGGPDAYYAYGASGDIRPCNHSTRVLGNVKVHRLRDVADGERARAFWGAAPVECADCDHPLKDKCLGGCLAAADECFGTPARRDPYVELCQARAPGGRADDSRQASVKEAGAAGA